jgi:predicted unusual protein kinase regulating ubiquinone biosynthesis (AarF/ABC1/UbiB family)
MVRHSGLETVLAEDQEMEAPAEGKPEHLAQDLEALGPTFVKLGQLLSTRPDLLPEPYLDALSRLQDRVEPFPFEEVEEIVQQELGVRISKAFEHFEAEPIAAASLGQVHRATLRDGRPVAVKVQRPGVRLFVQEDLEALAEVAAFLDEHTEAGRRYAFHDMLGEFRHTLLRELDYVREAENLVTLQDNLASYKEITVPLPVRDYTTSRVLTMDFVRGTKVTTLSPLARLELDGTALAEALSKAYLDQVLVDGFFHADPHPGNVFITDPDPEHPGRRRLALLDLGMVARIDPGMQVELLKLLLAISEGRGREVAEISSKIGVVLSDFDREHYARAVAALVAQFQDATLANIQIGRVLVELSRISVANGLRPAPELTMLGKTLLNLDEIARTLDPVFDPNAVVRAHADSIMRRRMLKNLSPGNLFSSVLELNELIQTLPGRLNTLLDALVKKEFEVRVRGIDELRLLTNLHTIANRLALSVVLAALIVGAALMMRVETQFTVFGYPGIAMLLFLLAAGCGFYLVFSIIFGTDRRPREGGKGP